MCLYDDIHLFATFQSESYYITVLFQYKGNLVLLKKGEKIDKEGRI